MRSKLWILAGVLAVSMPVAAEEAEERQKIEPRGGLIELFRTWGDDEPGKKAPVSKRRPRTPSTKERVEKPKPEEKEGAERRGAEPEPESAKPVETEPAPEAVTAEPEPKAPPAAKAEPEIFEAEGQSETPDAAERERAEPSPEKPSETERAEPGAAEPDEDSERATEEAAPARRGESAGTASAGDVRLPEQDILGELEKPGILFLLPRARDRSDEQIIRSRLRREITKPLIKEWLEESLLLE